VAVAVGSTGMVPELAQMAVDAETILVAPGRPAS
jgi:hypothetical protein